MSTSSKNVNEKSPSLEVKNAVLDVDVESSQNPEDGEIFRTDADGQNYRTVSWYRTFALMFKVLFSTGVLSIPGVFSYVGAVPGALLVIGWGCFNTYAAFLLGSFKLRHANIHDMAFVVGGAWYRELVGLLYLLGYVLIAGSGYIGMATAFNALSEHGACTVWFTFIAFVLSTALALFPKLSQIGIAAWIGVITLFISIMTVVVAVGVQDRPALAPAGDFDLGYYAFGSPTFLSGMSATLIIFVSSSGTSAFIPIIAEMRNPAEYRKPIACSMGLLGACYLAFSLVVYRYCGVWIASPALGSAGPLIKKISYGIALPGLLISATLCQHLAAKYLFVRLLKGTEHLQGRTKTHWATWIGSTVGCGVFAFVICGAVPFFGSLIGLIGAIAYAPMAIVVPMHLWLHDFGHCRKESLVGKAKWLFHVTMLAIGLFMTVGGAYAMIATINDQFKTGLVDSPFSCADNS